MLSPRSVVLTKLFEEPDKSDKRSVAASATIFDTGLPASKYKAATPATWGLAMEVPAFVLVPPVLDKDTIEDPGAKMSTQLPQFEKDERAFVIVIAPTVSAFDAEAGE
jgi:hypothetical protein